MRPQPELPLTKVSSEAFNKWTLNLNDPQLENEFTPTRVSCLFVCLKIKKNIT